MIYFYFIVLACIVFTFQKIYSNGLKSELETTEALRKKSMRQCCVICAIALALIAGLRAVIVGVDTYAYYTLFVQAGSKSFLHNLTSEEPIWYVISWILNAINADYQWLLGVIGLVYAVGVSYFIYNQSEEPFVSYVMLIPMLYFAFTMSGQRQTLAMALAFFAYPLAIERKYFKFFRILIFAILCHKSAWLLIPLLFISKKKVPTLERIVYLLSLPIIYILRSPILGFAKSFLYDNYGIYTKEEAAWPTFIMYVCIWLVFVFFGEHEKDNAPFFERMLMIGIAVQMFVPLQPNIFRIALYYQVSSLVLVPNFMNAKFFSKSRPIAYMVFMAVMLLMYFAFTFNSAGANPYYFFWQVSYK